MPTRINQTVWREHAQDKSKAQEDMLKRGCIISPCLFPSPEGAATKQQRYRDAWGCYRVYNGLSDISPYEMRHTFVSMNKSMPEGLKKLVMGHSKDFDTEGTYGYAMQGDLEAAFESY